MQFWNLKVPVFFLLSCVLCSPSLLGETPCRLPELCLGGKAIPLIWFCLWSGSQIWQSLKLISYWGRGFEATNYNCFGWEYRRSWLFQPLKTSNYRTLGENYFANPAQRDVLSISIPACILASCYLSPFLLEDFAGKSKQQSTHIKILPLSSESL